MRECVPNKRIVRSSVDGSLDAVITIPAYREGYALIDCLYSIITQDVPQNITFAVTIVINNPKDAPPEEYAANMRTYTLLQALRSDKRVSFSGEDVRDFAVSPNAHELTEKLRVIQHSGIEINIVDLFSPEYAQHNSNVGLARHAALETSLGMLKNNNRALYITTDADTKLHPLFLRDALELFNQRTDIHALSGKIVTDMAGVDAISRRAYEDSVLYSDLAYHLGKFVAYTNRGNLHDSHAQSKERASYLCGSATVVTKGALMHIDGYQSVNTGEDMQLGIDLRERGYIVADARLAPNIAVYTSARRSNRTDHGFGRTIQDWSETPFEEHLVTRFEYAQQAEAMLDELADIHRDELCEDDCVTQRIHTIGEQMQLFEHEIQHILRAYRAGETTPSIFTNTRLLGTVKRIFTDERFVVPLAHYVTAAEEMLMQSELQEAWTAYQNAHSVRTQFELRARIGALVSFLNEAISRE